MQNCYILYSVNQKHNKPPLPTPPPPPGPERSGMGPE